MPSWLGAHAENGVASPQIFHFNHCPIGLGGPKGVHRAGTDRQLKKHDLKEYRRVGKFLPLDGKTGSFHG